MTPPWSGVAVRTTSGYLIGPGVSAASGWKGGRAGTRRSSRPCPEAVPGVSGLRSYARAVVRSDALLDGIGDLVGGVPGVGVNEHAREAVRQVWEPSYRDVDSRLAESLTERFSLVA